jgi:glycosyltransferase involved in cell wall biosynthesis
VIHLVGLPHTQFDDVKYSSCAFTAKAVRMARMIRATGREVTVYWGGNKADVCCLPLEEQERYFGKWDPNELPKIVWDASLPYWKRFHGKCRDEIDARIQPNDIVGFIGGPISQELISYYKDRYTVIEPGVGYEGLSLDTFACFESYAWMHSRYGQYRIGDGRAFDTVIPNAVDPDEWEMAPSDGYALFVGRLIARKGPHVAAQIANAAGLPLVMAGGGVAKREKGRITATDGTVIEGKVKHVGAVSGVKRRELFSKALVLICPTLYIGPWEGVHAEAMMSGVGVVAPDYGVFTETLPREHRYRSLKEAVQAVEISTMNRGSWWRTRAKAMFGIEVCTRMYGDWFDALESLRDGRNGWYR